LVGLGVGDERDLGTRALEALGRADRVLAESYTSLWPPGTRERLSALLGKEVQSVSRAELESERVVLEPLQQGLTVALVVGGEPLAATTHLSLRLAVERAGHAWRLYHHSSILTAAASLVGLSHYKFGRTVSLPLFSERIRPDSSYDGILSNDRSGLHTLVLLDLDAEADRYLTAREAVGLLAQMEEARHGGVLTPGRRVAVVARVGREDPWVRVGAWERVASWDPGSPPHSLVLPARELHFLEEEALELWQRRETPAHASPIGPVERPA